MLALLPWNRLVRVLLKRDFVGKAFAFVGSSFLVAKRIQRMIAATNKTEVITGSIISPRSNEEMIHLFGAGSGSPSLSRTI
jgi:hypothetical protein